MLTTGRSCTILGCRRIDQRLLVQISIPSPVTWSRRLRELVGGHWNHGMDYDFPETLGNGKSSQLEKNSIIFQRSRAKNHQPDRVFHVFSEFWWPWFAPNVQLDLFFQSHDDRIGILFRIVSGWLWLVHLYITPKTWPFQVTQFRE